eukprot:scaffold28479_cov45-Phaeocystis_antarctica.AAC.3
MSLIIRKVAHSEILIASYEGKALITGTMSLWIHERKKAGLEIEYNAAICVSARGAVEAISETSRSSAFRPGG